MDAQRLDSILNLVGYCYDFLRGARSQAKAGLHLRRGAARRGYLDVASLVAEETLLFGESGELSARPTQQGRVNSSLSDIGAESDELADLEESTGEVEPSTATAEPEQEVAFDVLRRMYGLVRANPHELESIYGMLFLEGYAHTSRNHLIDRKARPILAPLVIAQVSIKYDSDKDAIVIECEHDYARLNTYAISELMPETYDAMEDTLRDLVQLPLPLDASTIQKILRTLQTVGGLVEVPPELNHEAELLRVLERQTGVASSLPSGRFRLQRYAALAVVRRGNVFVLDDLDQMAKLDSKAFEGSLLARFALAEEGFEENHEEERKRSLLGEGEILFPFLANDRQINVAHGIEQHGLIRVQGPPGTGKSQTIANLVCHLVARGKRVLVASQQQKAVEVIQEYLEKLGIDFLPMTLLKGDREATRMLKSRLDGLAAFTFNRSAHELHRQGQLNDQLVAKLRQRMLELQSELGRSLVFETTPWGGTGKRPGELSVEYATYRGSDLMAKEESVAWAQQTEVVTLLEQAVALTRRLKGQRLQIAGFCESTQLPEGKEIGDLLKDILSIKDALEQEFLLCPRAKTAIVKELPLFPARSECTPEEVAGLKESLAQQIYRLDGLTDKETVQVIIEATANHDPTACQTDLESLSKFLEILQRLPKMEEDASGCGNGGVEPSQLAEALEVYEAYRMKWGSWLVPAFRKRRRIVATALGRERLTRTTDISGVRARVQANHLRMRLSEVKARRLSHLSILEIPSHFDMATERRLIGLCSEVKEGLQIRNAACKLSFETMKTLARDVNPSMFIDQNGIRDIHGQVKQIKEAREAERAAKIARELENKWVLAKRGGYLKDLAGAVERGDPEEARRIAAYLESHLPLVPVFRDLVRLLGGPLEPWRGSAEVWIRRAEEDQPANFREEILSQVHARALRTELSAANELSPRDASLIAEEKRRVEEEYREAARESVQAYLHAQIVEAYAKAAIGNEVRYFSKILQKGKRNYEAFLKLKGSPKTFEAVLSVLPCWVATIQDVARVFPLRSHLFNIVIVDEASQCSIPSALPLFLRSQKAIVVGDDKQLPCVEGKFVSRAYNGELISRHHLYDNLPRPESFNACESSLFDLAGNFTERPIFLAEHFRCHPDIIAFSNRRFYDDRLIILTHGMDESLGPPTEIIQVKVGSDDPRTKVNRREAEAVVRKLRELVSDPRYEGMDFGVCSPFRNQADFIWELIIREFNDNEIRDRKLVSATADGFQGDERDVILYSFRYAPNSSPRIFTLTDGVEGQQRMNVAITRPRRRAICFVSHSVENFPPGLVRDFLRHAANPRTTVLDGEPWDSQFEKDVHAFLESKGLEVRPQVRACGYKLDFVLRGPDGRIAALEADGWEIHYPDGKLREEDVQRQGVLERAGWEVFRVQSRAFYRDPENALAHVLDYFAADEFAEGIGEGAVGISGAPPDTRQPVESPIDAAEIRLVREPVVDPNTIPIEKMQEALRFAAPEPGVELQRDEIYRRGLGLFGLQRLGKRTRDRFQSAMNGLIRRGEFGYRGRDTVWKLKVSKEASTGDEAYISSEDSHEQIGLESFKERIEGPSKPIDKADTSKTVGVEALFPPTSEVTERQVAIDSSLKTSPEDDITWVIQIGASVWYDLFTWANRLGYFTIHERNVFYRVAKGIGWKGSVSHNDAKLARKLYNKATWKGWTRGS